VRLLIDNALSPRVAAGLREAGHDAIHVRDYDMARARDPLILQRAAEESRILVTSDTDFGALLALGRLDHPSVILLRVPSSRTTEDKLALLLAHLPSIEPVFVDECIVVIEEHRLRVHRLPII
jgi:predicted nuclease of predicted toxin-antitoxin system